MRLLLIRHGRSAHVGGGGLLGRTEVERWRAAYDAAGTAEDDRPPESLLAEVARADLVAASDLPRAMTSAARLARGRALTVSPLLRELPLPIPALPVRAPLWVWGALIHARWGIEIVRGRDVSPDARGQAELAAAWCRESGRLAPGGTIAAVTHGVFRRLLTRQLIAEGWRLERGRRGYGHWSVWRLRAESGMASSGGIL